MSKETSPKEVKSKEVLPKQTTLKEVVSKETVSKKVKNTAPKETKPQEPTATKTNSKPRLSYIVTEHLTNISNKVQKTVLIAYRFAQRKYSQLIYKEELAKLDTEKKKVISAIIAVTLLLAFLIPNTLFLRMQLRGQKSDNNSLQFQLTRAKQQNKELEEKKANLEKEKENLKSLAEKAKLIEEKQKTENEKKELEKKISQAVAINNDLPEETDDAPKNTVEEAKQANTKYIETTQQAPNGKKLLNVIKISDGDTITLSEIGTIRMIGVDTPETVDPRKTVQCFGKEASDFTKGQLSVAKVYLEFDETQGRIDKYGRTLAYVFKEDGTNYNKQLISEGFAHEYTYKLPYKYQADFKQAQADAKAQGRGLWNANTCNGDTKQGAKQTAPAPTPAPAPVPAGNQVGAATGGYVAGSCTKLKSMGLCGFTAGDPNYTRARDKDGDGIACDCNK